MIRRSDYNDMRKEQEVGKLQTANITASFVQLGCWERAEAGE